MDTLTRPVATRSLVLNVAGAQAGDGAEHEQAADRGAYREGLVEQVTARIEAASGSRLEVDSAVDLWL